ncbi:MAG: GMC family oxidoreductase, partial [Acidobacteria bacterium]|nr:GMC family oxidoreductase [Acidobacteriota bacterium]
AMQKTETFDAIVVGSGMTGGVAASELCKAGLKVLVLEAGGAQDDLRSDQGIHAEQRFAGHQVQNKCYAFAEATSQLFVNDHDNPYLVSPEQPFSWIRARAVGGRSLLWAGHCYRMTDAEFRAAREDGIGENWPICYQEIAPYYDKAERLLGVRSRSFTNARNEACLAHDETHFGEAFARLGPALIRARVSFYGGERTPCLHCGRENAFCSRPVSSPNSTLAEAFSTGRMQLWTESPVRHIEIAGNGRHARICGIRRKTGQVFEVCGRLVFLCASTLESTRILLNSTSSRFPNGLGNSSGVLGRYLMDHVSGISVTGVFNRDIPPNEGAGAGMFYVPNWQEPCSSRNRGFSRGYGYQLFTMRADHELLPCGGTKLIPVQQSESASGNAMVRIVGFGEMLPYDNNYVEIDKEGGKDADGIPILRISCSLRDNEKSMAKHMLASAQELLQSAHVKVTDIQTGPAEPGLAIHEAGTCRMGSDARTSMLNSFNQCHDVPNVFVTDGSSFPSIGVQNPVLTMVALTIRACECAVQQLRKGET